MIPKVIWQTHEYDFKDLPYPYNLNAKTWIEKNPRYKYNYVNAEARRNQIDFLRPDLLYMYDQVPSKVTQADIWRYVVLAEYGGFYADLDSVCLKPLNIDLTQEFIATAGKGYFKCKGNWETFENVQTKHIECDQYTSDEINNSHFACSSKNKILNHLLEVVKQNFEIAYPNGVGMYDMDHHHITDPIVYANLLLQYKARVSKSIVYYEPVHKGYDKCTTGWARDLLEICHGDLHKNTYIAVD